MKLIIFATGVGVLTCLCGLKVPDPKAFLMIIGVISLYALCENFIK